MHESFSVFDGDEYIERKLFVVCIHVHVKEQEWEVIYRLVNDGKENETRSFYADFSGDRGVHRNVRSGFRLNPRITISEVSTFKIEFTIKSARKLVLNRQ